jgi:hypothetical protein
MSVFYSQHSVVNNRHRIRLIVIATAILLFLSVKAAAATVTTRVTGAANWNTASTWVKTLTGTATFTKSSTTVTGTGTLFTTELAVNDVIMILSAPGTTLTVASIQTNTSLTVSVAPAGNSSGAYGKEAAPTSSDDVVIGNTNLTTPAVTVTLDASSATVNSLTLTATGVSNSLTHSGTNALTISGAVTINQPTANTTTVAWNINGGSATVSGLITFAGTNTTTTRIGKVVITTGTLNANGGITFTASAAATKVIDMSTGGGTGTLNLKGALTVPAASSTLTAGTSGSIFNYADTVAQTVNFFSAGAYNELHLNNTSATGATLSAAVTATNITGNISVQTGTFDNGGFAITLTSAKNFSVSNGATFNLSGISTMVTVSGGGTKTFGATSVVNYTGTAQTVTAEGYGNLTLSGSTTKTMPTSSMTIAGNFSMSGTPSATAGAAITFNGNFTLGSGTTFSGSSFTHSVAGNWSNSGTFNANTSTVIFNAASGTQTIGGSSNSAFNKLTLSNNTTRQFGDNATAKTFSVGSTLTWSAGPIIVGQAAPVADQLSIFTASTSLTMGGTLTTQGGGGFRLGAFGSVTGIQIESGSTLTAASGTDITTDGNWRNNGTYTKSTETVRMGGATTVAITGSSNTTFNVLNLGTTLTGTQSKTINIGHSTAGSALTTTAATLNIGSTVSGTTTAVNLGTNGTANTTAQTLTVTGNLTISATGTNSLVSTGNPTTLANVINVGGNWSNSGTLTAGGSTVTLNAASGTQTIGGSSDTTFNSLTLSNNTTRQFGDNASAKTFTVGGTLTWSAGPIIVGQAAPVADQLVISTASTSLTMVGTLTTQGGGGFHLGGSGSVTGIQIDSGSTLTAASGTNITTDGNWSNSGTYTKSTETVTMGGATTVAITGSSNTTFNVLNLGTTLTGTQSKTINIGHSTAGSALTTTAATLNIGSTVSGTTTAVNLGTNGTANTTAQTLTATGNLTINATGTNSLVSTGNPTTLANAINVGGNWSNSGTFTAGGSTVTFNAASGTQTIGGSSSTTFNSLTLSNNTTRQFGNNASAKTFTVASTLTWSAGPVIVGQAAPVADQLVISTASTSLTMGGTLTTQGAGGFHLGGSGSVTGIQIDSGSTLTAASGTDITTDGNWSNSGAYTKSTETVMFNGASAQSISGSAATSFNNLTDSNTSATLSASTNFNVSGTLNMNGSATVLNPNSSVVINNAAAAGTLTGTGTVKVTKASNSDDFKTQYKFGTYTLTNLTVDYAGTATQEASAASYSTLILSNTGTVTASSATGISVSGTMTVSGTFNPGSSVVINNGGAVGTLTGGGTVQVTGATGTNDFDKQYKFSTYTLTSLTVDYAGTAGQEASAHSYSNLTISNTTAAVTASSATGISVSGTMNVGSGATFTPGATVVLNNGGATGTITGSGTVKVTRTAATADYLSQYKFTTNTLTNLTVEYAGASAQTVSALTYGSLKINNSSGVTLAGNTTVNGTLTFTSGNITTGSNILAMGSSATASRTSGHVIGTLEKTAVPDGAFTFHVGTSNGYTPLSLANSVNGGSLRVKTVASVQPTVNQTRSLNEYWTLTLTSGSLTTDMTFTYLQGDVQGTEANYRLIRVASGTSVSFYNNCPTPVTNTACVDTTANTAYFTGVSAFTADWTVGEPASPTAVTLARFTATAFSDGVMLEWQSGFEVNNLGYNLYRLQNGQRTRVTPSLIAGSALMRAGSSTLTSGFSYGWFDREGTAGTQYVLEAVDVNGEPVEYTPLQSVRGGAHNKGARSMLLNEIGAAAATGSGKLAQRSWAAAAKPLPGVSLTKAAKSASGTDATQSLTAQQWIAAQSAVKIQVNQTGWYRVTQPQLVAAGFDPSTDARFLQLYTDAQERPIRLSGDQGRLGPSDAIEFYGVGLDTPTTDTSTYYLVLGNFPGLRIDAKPDRVRINSDSLAQEFAYTIERKDRVIYLPGLLNGDADNIFGPPVMPARAATQTLTVQNLNAAAAPDAQLEVVLQGYTNVNHQVQVQLNGAYVGTVSSSATAHPTTQFPIASSMLKEGDNTVTLIAAGGQSDISFVDAVRVTYPHSYRADNDTLNFTVPAGDAVSVTGFTTAHIRVIDITDPSTPLEVIPDWKQAERANPELPPGISQQGNTYAFDLQPSSTTRNFIASADTLIQQPAAVFKNQPSTLSATANAADLLIITHADFRQGVEPLAAARRAEGLNVAVVDVEDVYDEFSYGTHTPQALRDFLAWAGSHWTTPPQYVLLVGDSSWDPRNYLGQGYNDFVPTKLIDTAELETASDDWLVDFNGDGIPALAVGRLPVRSAADATVIVNKILAYDKERAEASPTQRGALLVADRGFEPQTSAVQSILAPITSVQTISRAAAVSDVQARSQIITAIDNGPDIVNYFGHGSVDVWTSAPLLNEDDAESLTNSSRLSLFVMMTCLNGYFHDAYIDSLGEKLLKVPQGGAVAVWASSGITDPGSQAQMNEQFYQLLVGDHSTTLGQAIRGAKMTTQNLDVRRTWTLLGDPSMRIR